MKTIQSSGKNVEKAIEKALQEIGKNQDEVDIKILDEGGFFRKAKVEISYEDKECKVENKTSEKAEEKTENKCENKTEKETEEKVETEIEAKSQEEKKEVENKNLDRKPIEEFCTEFLKNLCEKMSVEAEITYSRAGNEITFNACGENAGNLIGKRGETLNAIQEIMMNSAKNAGYKNEKVYFDVENYKNRREISLINLGERMAQKAKKLGKPVKLERMNAYERKIIHTALSSIEGVSTHSEGEEPNRCLIIIPDKID